MNTATTSVLESERYCRALTRKSATSFYYAFKTLPRRKARAFEIVYAFMRISDDKSDDAIDRDRRDALVEWRTMLHAALNGDPGGHLVMPALMDVVREFEIKPQWLDELIDGVEQDLVVTRFATTQELRDYCYKVASVVGLVSLRIFGLERPSDAAWQDAERLAIDCGQAFQLTNILRDVKEDLERDRIYLPQDVLGRFQIGEADLRSLRCDDRFRAMMKFLVARAEADYAGSEALVARIERDARPCLATMRGIYHGILERIVAADYDVFRHRARLPLTRKLGIAARALLGRFRP
ncbi:MAG: phytoene/squalene synthase family protein [Planctomycetes bacterium]|nr:phytoene/squalene synthase family protein [Planctomycetota bacterium]